MGFGGNILIGSEVEFRGELHVDPVTGDNATAERGNLNKPYATITAAYVDYMDNDLIIVHPGRLSEEGVVFNNNGNGNLSVHLEFKQGARMIGSSANTPLLNASNVPMYIYGRGYFETANNTNSQGVFTSTPSFYVHGADTIKMAGGTGNVIGVRWAVVENVDLIEGESVFPTIKISVPTPDGRDGRSTGILRNVKMIRNFRAGGGVALELNHPATEKVYVENCNFEATSFSLHNTLDTNYAKFVNCTFKDILPAGRTTVSIGAYFDFINCQFENNDNLETIEVDDIAGEENSPRPIFENCTFTNNGIGSCIATRGAAEFRGVNKFFASAGLPLNGWYRSENKNNGVIIANRPDLVLGSQVWRFSVDEVAPTVGETYTITAPDATTISYTVLVADTQGDVVTGLAASWTTEAALGNNIWEKWTPLAILGVTNDVQATAINFADNLDPDDGFVPSTSGTDLFTQSTLAIQGFTTIGGKMIVDDNMVNQPII